MMKIFKSLVTSLLLICVLTPLSFSQTIIDTIYKPEGTMLIYANHTWEYLEDRDFDGILNPDLVKLINSDSTLNFVKTWDNDVCYTSQLKNDLTLLKDTLWLCVTDSAYSGFVMPFEGRITSRYGYRRGRYHNGIDIDLETGDTVRAAFDGKIRYAKYNESGFGNLVVIRHPNGLETFYAHLSKHLTVPNQVVKAGDPIGLGGNTGHSRGSHLHFETRFYDAPMNPEEVIDFAKKEIRGENLFVHKGLFRPGASPSYSNGYTASSGSSTGTAGKRYHKIRSGDTLGHISRKYGTTVSKLCQLNGIRPTTTLHIGKSIRVK